MDEPGLRLHRYQGRYQIGTFVLRRQLIERVVTVHVDGDHLAIERSSGQTHPLVQSSEHRFDAEDGSRSFEFNIGSDGIAKSLTLIRDGTVSEPGPRLVPIPHRVDAQREMLESIDLGHVGLCMKTAHAGRAAAFYERLGFRSDGAHEVMQQGFTVIAFFDFMRSHCLNFRGPSILATGTELARRGYELIGLDYQAERVRRDELRNDEAGFFSVYDPDDNHLFFNTHADERITYEAWKNGDPSPGGSFQDASKVDVPVSLELGELVVCLQVTDLPTTVRFYRGLGSAVVDETEDTATIFVTPARKNPYAFPLRLRQAETPNFTFAFRCVDVAGVCADIEALGIELVSTLDGPAFVDPDLNQVALLPASTPFP